jgi:hypothetical protein
VENLELYPLAKAYRWKEPKHDTGGIFYLYPPVVSAVRRHYRGMDYDFHRMKRARIDGLNPDEVMADIEMRDCYEKEPRFLNHK